MIVGMSKREHNSVIAATNRKQEMTKAITIRGTEYIYYVRTGDVYSMTASGLPSAGAVLTAIYGAKKTRVIDAMIKAGV